MIESPCYFNKSPSYEAYVTVHLCGHITAKDLGLQEQSQANFADILWVPSTRDTIGQIQVVNYCCVALHPHTLQDGRFGEYRLGYGLHPTFCMGQSI